MCTREENLLAQEHNVTAQFYFKKDCPECERVKPVVEEAVQNGMEIEEFDLSTVDGVAEAAYNEVYYTPVLRVQRPNGMWVKVPGEEGILRELARIRGDVSGG